MEGETSCLHGSILEAPKFPENLSILFNTPSRDLTHSIASSLLPNVSRSICINGLCPHCLRIGVISKKMGEEEKMAEKMKKGRYKSERRWPFLEKGDESILLYYSLRTCRKSVIAIYLGSLAKRLPTIPM
jgi:hypothetical protein